MRWRSTADAVWSTLRTLSEVTVDPMEERLVELELRYTHQQELLEQLSDVLATQQKEIAVLMAEVRQLRGHLASEPWREGSMPADEKPPHY